MMLGCICCHGPTDDEGNCPICDPDDFYAHSTEATARAIDAAAEEIDLIRMIRWAAERYSEATGLPLADDFNRQLADISRYLTEDVPDGV